MNKRGGFFEDLSHTLTIMVDKWGGVRFGNSKTLTHMVAKCGGGWSRESKTVTHDGVWNGTVAPPPLPGPYNILRYKKNCWCNSIQ